MVNPRVIAGERKKKKKKKKNLMITENLGHDRNSSLRCWFMCTPTPTYSREANPFQTDTEGRVFVVDVSINWPSNESWQTKVLDSGKTTQLD